MDVLKDKNYETYDYVSRYSSVPYYYNTEDEKYVYGLSSQIKKDISFVIHNVKDTDTLDSLALKYYNNPTLYWVIADFNNILDVFEQLSINNKTLKIPNISSISFGEER